MNLEIMGEQEAQALIDLMELGVKAGGLKSGAARAGVIFYERLQTAIKEERQQGGEEKPGEQPLQTRNGHPPAGSRTTEKISNDHIRAT